VSTVSKEFRDLEEEMNGTVKWNEPMSRHTSYGIGGTALGFFYPADEEDLKVLLRFVGHHGVEVFFAGSGSNLLVSDDGFDGFVISLAKHFKKLTIDGTSVFAQSGTMMGHFVKECIKNDLAGVESLIGVPGTLGGAIRMNAGAYGHEISNFLTTVNVITPDGKPKTYLKREIDFGYRYSSLTDREVLLSAQFEFQKGLPDKIAELKAKSSASRKLSQPLRFRSAGSVFKNPPHAQAAGYLIDKAGLKGKRSGDAEISPQHANFFVNHGKASAENIAELIRTARKEIKEKFDIDLELEIKTLGFPQGHFDA
jgi:UDP-N-acetylmuramate dehydrogenase|tara:strand:+ start:11645 stop:12577 length:933 start_codon:yes stop_codon:yes gene_type:complete